MAVPIYQIMWCHTPDGSYLHKHCCKNLIRGMSHLQILLTVVFDLLTLHRKSNIPHTPVHVQNAKPQYHKFITTVFSSKHCNHALISAAVPKPVRVPNLYLATSCYAHLPASLNGTSAVRKFSENLDTISKF
jgi:hypothetical protein